jgi:hypothetical protein
MRLCATDQQTQISTLDFYFTHFVKGTQKFQTL